MSYDDLIMNQINKPQAASQTSNSSWAESGRNVKGELGKDEFLKLLAAQMANQDPMNTVSDTEFIAQMAQFSSLEQMQAMNTNFINSQAHSMVGKYVQVSTSIYNEKKGAYEKVDVTGLVTGTLNSGGKTYLQVGEYYVEPSQITATYDASGFENGLMNGSNMVGKYIQAFKKDEAGATVEINGKVDQIFVGKNGQFYAKVGTQDVLISSIQVVSDKDIPLAPPPPTP